MNKSKLNVSKVIAADTERKSQNEVKRPAFPEVVDGRTKEVYLPLLNDSTITFLWLVVFSILMFTFPFVAFYGVRSWLRESFDISDFYINCWAVLSSVLVVNAIICLYVFKAVLEENTNDSIPESETKKNY